MTSSSLFWALSRGHRAVQCVLWAYSSGFVEFLPYVGLMHVHFMAVIVGLGLLQMGPEAVMEHYRILQKCHGEV